MQKIKRFNSSVVATVVLAVVLVMAIAGGATLAWFASQDADSTHFLTANPVIVSVGTADHDLGEFSWHIDGTHLLPAMSVEPTIIVGLAQSNTPALLRARIDTTATWADDFSVTNLPFGWFRATEGQQGTQAEVDGTPDITVTDQHVTRNGVLFYTVAGMTELLQDQLNAAFRGVMIPQLAEAGWLLDGATGWYYFTGNGEDYSFRMTSIAGDASGAGDSLDGAAHDAHYQVADALSVLENTTVLASVASLEEAANIDFLVEEFIIPPTLGNEFADARIDVSFRVQAVQDYIRLEDDLTVGSGTVRLPELRFVRAIFESIIWENT